MIYIKFFVATLLTCITLSGCTQAVGTIEGQPYRDMKVSARDGLAPQCDITLTREKSASVEDKVYMGTITIEGPVWISREEMETMALQKGCENRATLALLSNEHYSVPVMGSWAEVELYR